VALKLDATLKVEASKRTTEAKNTARLFKFFFGHDPSRPVPWANNQASAAVVAHRLRSIAKELGGGRRMLFRCGCPDAGAEVRAQTNQTEEPNVINLCPRFWNPPADLRGLPPVAYRAGIILHEMLHVLYHEFFHHAGHPSGDPERRRDNAHCYEAFTLRAAGFGADPSDVRQCTNRLAGELGDWNGLGQPVTFPAEKVMEKKLIDDGIKLGTSLNDITNAVFWHRHPEFRACRLPASCDALKQLQKEWMGIHKKVETVKLVDDLFKNKQFP
jgi:hypothetical protein